ncbi:MAG: hypothetical protein L3K16_06320 [Thermoplasmata archaeon]|nr:hypothetical protein [Thermoplasmata archaeon]
MAGRVVALGVGATALLLLAGFAAACGTGGGGGYGAPPVCSTPGKAPAALYITLASPTKGVPAGGTLTASYEFAIVGFTSADANTTVTVPTTYARFPDAATNGTFTLQFAPMTLPGGNGNWSAPVVKTDVLASTLDFTTGGHAYLSTANLAVMIGGAPSNVTLEFRWGWTANRSGPTTSKWSTPTSTVTAPNYPSVFVAAPFVQVNDTSNTTLMSGTAFTIALWGSVQKTTFHTAIETTNGKELNCQTEKNGGWGSCFVYSIDATYQNGTNLPAGTYLVHVHDSMGAIVASISISVTNASGWGWGGHGGQTTVTCCPPSTGGHCGGGSGGWGGSGCGGGGRCNHHHGHW